jgi:hypothetical protein
MAVPKRIPVRRIAGYRTEYAGTWLRGQFLANVLSQSRRLAIDGDREWYAYLHEFDHNGAYLESTVECPGTGEAGRQAALQLLREWLAAVPGLTYGDIAIHPFQYEHDGTLFGLLSKTATTWTGPSSTPTGSASTTRGTGTTTHNEGSPGAVAHARPGCLGVG